MPPVVLCAVVSHVFVEIALRFMGRRLNRTVCLVRLLGERGVLAKYFLHLVGGHRDLIIGLANLVFAGCWSTVLAVDDDAFKNS